MQSILLQKVFCYKFSNWIRGSTWLIKDFIVPRKFDHVAYLQRGLKVYFAGALPLQKRIHKYVAISILTSS